MVAQTATKDIEIGGSIFWILLSALTISWLSYLIIWSYTNNSIRGAIVSMIFFAMVISGIVFSKGEIFNIGTWKENAISFTVGFGIWAFINGFFGTQSILSVSQNHLFATISGDLPQFIDVLMNGIIVPISEEFFWMFAIPYSVISVLNIIGKKYEFFSRGYVQILITAIISSATFASFHVGKSALIYFLISAVIFRTLMIGLVFGEAKYDFIKKFSLVASFSVGAHIANNLIQGGFWNAMIILQQNTVIFIMLLLFFASVFGTTMWFFGKWLFVGNKKVLL